MKLPYKLYDRSVLRPVVPIRLKYGTKGLLYEALVDSGADVSLFSREVGEVLGINIESGKSYKVRGVGGASSMYYMHEITLIIAGHTYQTEVGFEEESNDEVAPYGVIGQQGLFDHFTVRFSLAKKEIELESN